MSPQIDWGVVEMTCLKPSAGMLETTERIIHVVSSTFRNLCKLFCIIPHSWILLILPAALWYKYYHHFYFTQLGIRDLVKFPKVPRVIRLGNTSLSTSRFTPIFHSRTRGSFWASPRYGDSEAPQASKARAPQQLCFELQHWVFRKPPPSSCVMCDGRDRGRPIAEGPRAPPQLTLTWELPSRGCFYYHSLESLDMRSLLS